MGTERLYLYGFLDQSSELSLGSVGLDEREVYLTCHGDCSAAVSEVHGIDFTSLPKEKLLTYVAEHQRALERLMERGDVVPVKFGTLVQTSREMQAILAKGQGRIRETFAKVRGRTEMDVVARFSDFDEVLKEISMSEAIVTFQRKARPESKAALHQARVTLGKMVKAALDEKKKGYADAILKRLAGVSVEFRVLDVREDSMIVNIACLLEEKDLVRFETNIEALDGELEDRVHFRLIGPLPCNSFHTLMIRNINFAEIDGARKCLDLPERASVAEIKEAYKLMTRACHPDISPDGPGDSHRFESINKSYRLLMGVCRNGDISFLEEDANAWMDILPVEKEHRRAP